MIRTLAAFALALLFAYAPKAEAGDSPSWKMRPFVDPILGATFYSDGTTVYPGLGLGAQAGIRYHQKGKDDPFLMGTARVRGEYTIGQASGMEIRVGNFIGPWYKFIGLQTGPDVFWNQYSYGTVTLDPTLGLAWPIIAPIDLKVLSLYGGVSPAWYFSDRLPVDWSDEDMFGFGHEFSYMTGATIDAKVVELTVSYEYRITGYGPQKGIGAGIKLGL